MTSDLERAADVIEDYARLLFESHTVSGQWVASDEIGRRALAEHDEYRALANRLRKMRT